jgi:hypothetical protein
MGGDGMKVVLLVTWIVSLQPPSSYQVTFDSWEKCEAAKNAVLDDRARVLKQGWGGTGYIMGPGIHLPVVSAVCAAQ